MAKPTFVIVHGAWHSPAHFEPLIQSLSAYGYKAVAPALPSVAQSEVSPSTDSQDDIAAVRQAILAELDQGADVIVVPHSYGGVPATSAIRSLDPKSRADAGHTTSVVALAAITAYVLPEGASLYEAEQRPRPETNTLPAAMKWPSVELFYHDIPADEIEKWARLLKPMSSAALFDASRFSAHEVVPVHFLLAAQDKAISLKSQNHVLDLLRPKAVSIRTEEVDSDHSPFLGKIKQTADFLRRSAGEEVPETN